MLNYDQIIRIVMAVLLGGAVGFERELRDKPAGFRTIMLICVGACLFTIISEAIGQRDEEATRIAAQIVSGIGFLGAGAILRDRQAVFGLTTAATIWAVAAIGMAAGFGRLELAGLGTIVILAALWVFDIIEKWVGEVRDLQEYRIAAPKTEDSLDRITAKFQDAGLQVRKRSWYQEGDSLIVELVVMGSKGGHDRLRRFFARSEEYTLRRA